jgi:hypothetical protein
MFNLKKEQKELDIVRNRSPALAVAVIFKLHWVIELILCLFL